VKKILSLIIGALLVIAAVTGAYLAFHNSKTNNKANPQMVTASSSQPIAKPKRACSIFSLAVAKQLLGPNVKGGETPTTSSSKDLTVATCTYAQDAGSNTPVSSTKSASLLIRVPKTQAGTTSNQNQFGPLKPADAQIVSGYGDSAYWSTQFGQLNILKHDTWYILNYGPVTPSARTLDQTKQLADLIIDKM
jgi:hypothetical protein